MEETTPAAAPGGDAHALGLLGPYGVPLSSYGRLWRIADVADVLQVAVPRARALLAEAGAPPPVVTHARLRRWNGFAVMAWLHGEDWRGVVGVALPDVRAVEEAPPRSRVLLSQPAPRRRRTQT